MPGLCAILDTTGSIDVAARLDAMLTVMRHHAWYRDDRFVDTSAGLAVGRTSLGFVNAAPQPAECDHGSALVVMEGELYDADRAARELGLDSGSSEGRHAEILLAGYRQRGVAFLRQLKGSFVAVIWDAEKRQLILTNDRFGQRPLYWTKLPGRLVVASSLRALMLDADVSRDPNWRGIAQFFSFGQYFCQDTSLANVHVLPAAAWATFDVQSDRFKIDRYYQLADDCQASTGGTGELLEATDAAFARAVERRLQDNEHLGLALSGGLDARMILALAAGQGVPLKTVSYGIEGSLDHRCAAELSELVGCAHVNYVLDEGFLANYREHLDRMVELTDGQYLSQCIVLPTLPVYRELGIEVLLRGHAGELMHMHKAYAYSLDSAAMRIRSDAELQEWLAGHLQAYMLQGVTGRVFRGIDQAEIERLALESLREALAEAAAMDPPLARIWHLFVSQRLRRETALSLAKFGSVVAIRTPYWDEDLVPLLLRLPPHMKLDETIQSHLLKQRMPAFLEVVNSNTGTRIGASRFARKISTLRMRVLAKLGVRGYQPYERLGLWLRRELLPMVKDILLGEACLDRGVLDPDTVRAVIEQHQRKERNHTYLLMAMMIHELGQQRLADSTDSHTTTSSPDQSSAPL